jgi:hypothetical protein
LLCLRSTCLDHVDGKVHFVVHCGRFPRCSKATNAFLWCLKFGKPVLLLLFRSKNWNITDSWGNIIHKL